MIPQEDNVFVTQNPGLGCLENVQFLTERFGDSREGQWKNRRLLAHEEFTHYLEYLKNRLAASITKEETKRLMVQAYQGCDLRYQRSTKDLNQ